MPQARTAPAAVTWQRGEPRFYVAELDGYSRLSQSGHALTQLSVSVLDRAYNCREIHWWNQEQATGSRAVRRATIRLQARRLADRLNAEHERALEAGE